VSVRNLLGSGSEANDSDDVFSGSLEGGRGRRHGGHRPEVALHQLGMPGLR